MATNFLFIKYGEFFHVSMLCVSANNEHISSKFTPVTQWHIMNTQKSNELERSRSRSRVIKNHEGPLCEVRRHFLQYVTSTTTYDFFTFSKIVNFLPILLKMHTLCLNLYYVSCKNCIDQNKVTYVSMAMKIIIIKHREFFHISMFYIC